MTDTLFAHLRAITPYSACEGAARVRDIAAFARKAGIPAVAMTDTHTLAGVADFCEEMAANGVQPIIGATVRHAARNGVEGRVSLLAATRDGYRNLIRLISDANLIAPPGTAMPVIHTEALEAHGTGLLLLTGDWDGPACQALAKGRGEAAEQALGELAAVFGDRLYVEIARPGGRRHAAEDDLVRIADRLGAALVATVPSYYATAADHTAHDVLLCIGEGTVEDNRERRRVPEGSHLITPAEAARLFADLPDAVANTAGVALRCAHMFKKAEPMLPAFPGCPEGTDEEAHLRATAAAGLERRLQDAPAPVETAAYQARLAYELDVIARMGFCGYFLIVADFIGWARSQGIMVGPGRGSGAGSMVAWALGITDLDPLRYGLLFERFLNPDRVSMPDFDIDFCQARRDEVIRYVGQRYGAERVAQIGTVQKLQARAAVRDVGRVIGLPYPLVDRYVRMIPNNPGSPVTLGQAVDMDPLRGELAKADAKVKRLFDLALRIEGLHRGRSTHAAGVVIADRPIVETLAVYRDDDGVVVTDANMKFVEKAGLVKFDFLGLATLDVLDGATEMLAEQDIHLDLARLPINDPATFALLSRGDGFGVFQLESAGMRKAMRLVRPSTIDDIIALVALYRPGPMINIPTYAKVKHGEARMAVLHALMEPILRDTNGVVIYQEQVMQIAQALAGYSLGQADLLRRAMGKKDAQEMAAQRQAFVDGCQAGWVEVEFDDGRVVRMHAREQVRTTDGRAVTLQQALDEELDIAA